MSVSRFHRTRRVMASVCILALVLTACGESSDSESSSAATPGATIASETAAITETATEEPTATSSASNTPSVPPAATVEPTASPDATSTATTAPTPDPTATVVATEAATDRVEVIIEQFVFAPNVLEIPAGTTVVFTNRDPFEHTATESEYPYLFNSGNLNMGDSYEFTFDTPGTYEYFCLLHPTMRATIVVS